MTFTNNHGRDELLDGRLTYLARCFRIIRSDGTYYRLTEHDCDLNFPENALTASEDDLTSDNLTGSEWHTYSPQDGWDASATRAESAMKVSNMEFQGGITSSIITDSDLRAGLFDWAVVDMFWVDWRHPWMGAIRHNKFRLTDFQYDEEKWTVQCVNMMSELQRKSGKLYSKTCWHAFGDSYCGIDMQALGTTLFTGNASAPSTTNMFYAENGAGGNIENGVLGEVYEGLKHGHLKWTSGANIGQIYPIYKTINGSKQIFLQYPTRAAIADGDTFTAYAGCSKSVDACKAWSNLDNFGGFAEIPGTTQITKTGQLGV